jgi:ABC-type oligopeptide transport system substrate-binding subunit
MQDAVGQRLANRYGVQRELGRGGMGVVFLARDELLEREVAIKVLGSAFESSARERFLREARVIARMDHPGIVPLYDIGEHQGALFLVMPFVRGETLRSLSRERRLTLGDVLAAGAQTAEALGHAHALGIVHRDVKPENVLVEGSGSSLRARLTDFGLARAAFAPRITGAHALVGTASYLSPEQLQGREVDARSDVYALGTLLYECLAGEPPFGGELQAVLYRIAHEPAPPIGQRAPGAPPEVAALVMACLSKDPAARPQSAQDVAAALSRARSAAAADVKSSMALSSTVQLSLTGRDLMPSGPLVGRERELGELRRRLDAAALGESQLVLLAGEHGVGKTRLCEELERMALARGMRVVLGHFGEHGHALPYQGFGEVLEQYCRSASAGSGTVADLGDLWNDLVALLPNLAEVPWPVPAAPRAAADQDRNAVFDVLARALGRIAAASPLLLVMEELHDAGVSIDALHYITRRLGALPLLFAGTFVGSEVDRAHPLARMMESLGGSRRFARIDLGALGPTDHRALVQALVPGARVSDALAHKLHELTEGSPFFTEEIVRALLDAEALQRDADGSWTASFDEAAWLEAMPATVHKAIEGRLHRLPGELREILTTASVLGQTFEYRDLESLCEGDLDLEEAVDRLVLGGFLREERKARGDRLAFTSGALRGVLHASLPRRQRRRLHQRAAEALEGRHKGKVDRVRAQLLLHWVEADVGGEVCRHGIELSKSALDAFAPDEAIAAARKVLDFAEDGEPAVEIDARLLLGEAQRLKDDPQSALRELEAAARAASRADDRERELAAVARGAEVAWESRRLHEAATWAERAIAAARELGAPSLRSLLLLGATAANLRGETDRAADWLAEADFVGSAIPPPSMGQHRGRGRLVVPVVEPVAVIDPGRAITQTEAEMLACCFETLTREQQGARIVPWLASEITAEDGGRRYRVRLREGVRFHDGRLVEANDVRASWERALCANSVPTASLAVIVGADDVHAGRASELRGLRAVGPNELEIDLVEPLAMFPAFLCDGQTSIRPADAGPGSLVGTGPYRVRRFDPGRRLELEPSPTYWRAGWPRNDGVTFLLGVDAAEAAALFRAGQCSAVIDPLPEDAAAFQQERVPFVDVHLLLTMALYLNVHQPPLSDVRIRRAVAAALPIRRLVAEHLGGRAVPAHGFLPPGLLGQKTVPPLDPEADVAPLAGLRLRCSLGVAAQNKYAAFSEALLRELERHGVQIERRPHLGPDVVDMRLTGWIADWPDADSMLYGALHSRHGRFGDLSGLPEIDEVLEAARRETAPAERRRLYARAERLLVEHAVVIPVFHGSRLLFARAEIGPEVAGVSGCFDVSALAPVTVGK